MAYKKARSRPRQALARNKITVLQRSAPVWMWLLYSDIWKTSKPPTTRLAGNAPARKPYHTRHALSTAVRAGILRRVKLIRHRVNHRNGWVTVVQRPLHTFQIVILAHQIDSIHLADAMRRDILRQAERLSSPLNVCPNCLSGAMLCRTLWTLKNPDFPRISQHFRRQFLRQIDTPALSRLLFPYPELQTWCLPRLRCLRRRSVFGWRSAAPRAAPLNLVCGGRGVRLRAL